MWETFVFAQLRERQRRAGRMGSLFFWCDRTRKVDFAVDIGGRLELFEAKRTEVPAAVDAVNLDFVRNVAGRSRIASGAIICRTSNGFPIADGLPALSVTELGLTTPNGERRDLLPDRGSLLVINKQSLRLAPA